jgi:23S rRNA pseudouridine2605 synthase
MSLTEGKNREVRKVLAHLGLAVTRLIRVSYGPYHLGSLVRGEVEEISGKVIAEQLGGKPAKQPVNQTAKPKAKSKHAKEKRRKAGGA